jgi:hypothetical protein
MVEAFWITNSDWQAMREFFQGWRRKAWCIALILSVAWIIVEAVFLPGLGSDTLARAKGVRNYSLFAWLALAIALISSFTLWPRRKPKTVNPTTEKN